MPEGHCLLRAVQEGVSAALPDRIGAASVAGCLSMEGGHRPVPGDKAAGCGAQLGISGLLPSGLFESKCFVTAFPFVAELVCTL